MNQRIILSADASPLFLPALKSAKAELITVPRFDTVYSAISSHPDIFLCPLGNHSGDPLTGPAESPSNRAMVVAAPIFVSNLALILKNICPEEGCSAIPNHAQALRVISGQSDPGAQYPESARYNALTVGRYFIHNPRITDPVLRTAAEESGYTLISVKQGYARCAALPIGDSALITADQGIARAARQAGIDVLSIRPGYVELPGFPYGFLGGAAGPIDGTVWFHGNLKEHPNFQAIVEFIRVRGFNVRWFSEFPLTDIGSVFCV